jgi:hypothetical protein
MDRDRLSRLLEEPGKVAREDLADLKALTERYPWFSGAHLLRAVGEQAGGDVLADEALQACAAHIPSRSVLFDLKDVSMEQAAADLKKLKEAPSEKTATLEIAPPEIEVAKQPEIPLVEDPAPIEEPVSEEVPVMPAAQEEQDAPPTLIPEIAAEVPPTEVTLPEPVTLDPSPMEAEDASPAVTPDATPAELDAQIIQAALANAYDLTWQERIAIPKEKSAASPARPGIMSFIQEETLGNTGKTSGIESEASSEKSAGKPAAPVRITKGTKLKFTDWLQADETGKEEIKAEVPAARIDRSENLPERPAAKQERPAPVDPKALIDRFIEQETPAPVRKTEFYSPQQAAKKSLDDTAGLVSETLAKVYVKQGNIPKAIDAYRRLALKYPEKSAYFAALSKELEGKLNA